MLCVRTHALVPACGWSRSTARARREARLTDVAKENTERAGFIYDKARQSGVSDEQSRRMATDLADPRPLRKYESHNWRTADALAKPVEKYSGPAPRIDSPLWLRKLMMDVSSAPIKIGMAKLGLPLVIDYAVDLDDKRTDALGNVSVTGGWWDDGLLRLRVRYRFQNERQEDWLYGVPIGACLNHDTRRVYKQVLGPLCGVNTDYVITAIRRMTDLFHVHGGD